MSNCYKYVLYVVVERQILYTCMFRKSRTVSKSPEICLCCVFWWTRSFLSWCGLYRASNATQLSALISNIRSLLSIFKEHCTLAVHQRQLFIKVYMSLSATSQHENLVSLLILFASFSVQQRERHHNSSWRSIVCPKYDFSTYI